MQAVSRQRHMSDANVPVHLLGKWAVMFVCVCVCVQQLHSLGALLDRS
jgi:hypothetical protein